MDWRVHWLEAEGDLGPWRERIAAEIEAGRTAIARILPLPSLDILVQRVPGGVIPETGDTGMAYRKGLLSLTVDPDNINFADHLHGGGVRRTIVHEVHHCLRMGRPGYGLTLGEALVSEGLAGRFVGHLFGSPPEAWEAAVGDDMLRAHLPDAFALASSRYDHAAWFLGDGDLPRWLGYTLGYRLVGDWLAEIPGIDGPNWVGVSADVVLAARSGLLASRDPPTTP